MLVVTICWKCTRVWVLLWLLCCEYRSRLFSHVVDAIALSICIVLRAFVLSMCLLYVSFGSRVSLRILG